MSITTSECYRMWESINRSNRIETVWYTTLPLIKRTCRLNGLTRKQSGRLVKKVAKEQMTMNQFLDHLSKVGTR